MLFIKAFYHFFCFCQKQNAHIGQNIIIKLSESTPASSRFIPTNFFPFFA